MWSLKHLQEIGLIDFVKATRTETVQLSAVNSSQAVVAHCISSFGSDHAFGASHRVRLRRGGEIPQLGLGTFQSKRGPECQRAVSAALEAGYRLIDTAAAYQNEADVAAGILEAGLHRSDVFICTKLQAKEHGSADTVRAALAASLKRLGTDHVDLYLIHNPKGGNILTVWPVMLELRDAGFARAVGVSNFGLEQLEGLKNAGFEMPEVNQIELHCWLQQGDVVDYHKKESIATMAYSPLARGQKLKETALSSVAEEVKQLEAAVAVRWSLQCGHIVIPKSKDPDRIRQNAACGFELSKAQMNRLHGLECGFHSIASSKCMHIPWSEVANSVAVDDRKAKKGKGGGTSRE